MVISEHGLPVEEVIVNPWQDRTPLKGRNPISKIPVLLLDDDTPIIDSWVITAYLDGMGEKPLLPSSQLERVKQQAACAICHEILNAGTFVVGSTLRGIPLPEELAAWHLQKCKDGLVELNRRLTQGEFGSSDSYNMLDLSTTATVGFFEFRLKDMCQWRDLAPDLASWFDETASNRKSAQETVPRHPTTT